MSEPGIFSLLMGRVRTEEQSGASALNFFAGFSVQAIAVIWAGSAYARFGYPPVLGAAACLAIIAALLFGLLLRRFER
jgi:apolipoprotein N-acyltransferase